MQYLGSSVELDSIIPYSFYLRHFISGGKMTVALVVLLFLASFQLSATDGVTCVTNALYPCKCTLSNGAGVVDISPLFSQGNLTTIDK